MAVLNREDFLARIQKLSGDDDSDEMLTCIADMTETFDAFNGADVDRYKNEAQEWKTKYEDNDKEWRQKYKNAFFGPKDSNVQFSSPADKEIRANNAIRISDLFTKKQ